MALYEKSASLTQGFSYDMPVVTALGSVNGPSFGSQVLTVQGKNFGSKDYQAKGTLVAQAGAGDCYSTSWTSDSQIECVTPEGVGPAVNVMVCLRLSIFSTSFHLF
jgi:hypothetical protein